MGKAKLNGKVREYSPTKKMGVIMAGKQSYHFFASDMLYELEISELRKDLTLAFRPEPGEQKIYAREIEILEDPNALRYEIPNCFLHTRELSLDDWDTVEMSRDMYRAYSDLSFEDALNKLVENAKAVGANALLDIKKLQNPQGARYGYRGYYAVVAKPVANGAHSRLDLIGLNQRLRKANGGDKTVLWIVAGGISTLVVSTVIVLLII
jgi:hypothetical protein